MLNLSQPNRPSTHAPLERTTPASPIALNVGALVSQFKATGDERTGGTYSTGHSTPIAGGNSAGGSGTASPAGTSQISQSQQQKVILDNLAKLMSACVILRIEDFTLYRVTTSGKKQMPKEFVSGEFCFCCFRKYICVCVTNKVIHYSIIHTNWPIRITLHRFGQYFSSYM